MRKQYIQFIKFILIFLSLNFIIDSCIIVKRESKYEAVSSVTLSPKPLMEMSDVHVRSKKGDMIAFLPKDWFFVDVEEKASSDIFAVAVNPDYTLSAVFSVIRKTDRIDSVVSKEGLLGLARIAFDRHERKTAGAVKQNGVYSTIQMGSFPLAEFNYFATGNSAKAQSAVFVSSINQYYEITLIPMNISGKKIPEKEDIDKYFQSILATIQVQY